MKIHLVTYATPRFRHRQAILGWSARLNRVVDTVTHWNPIKLLEAGFSEHCPGIGLYERGSGFWAWKPFIIREALSKVPEGDIVFYSDIGRRYPFKTLSQPIVPYLQWMKRENQDVMPGVRIPWKGPMSMWTKRVAFQAVNLDTETAYRSIPIQASFSIWITSPASREICSDWLHLCSQINLINDTPSPPPIKELPDFFENRHDQSLLSLTCLKHHIKGVSIGDAMPPIDTQHPDEILDFLGYPRVKTRLPGRMVDACAGILSTAERLMRNRIKFGEARQEPDYQAIPTSRDS